MKPPVEQQPSLPIPFALGEELWWIGHGSRQEMIPCPDCDGTKAITVINGRGERFSVDCAGCAGGYNPPKGYITITIPEHRPERFTPRRGRIDKIGTEDIWYSESSPEANCYSSVRASELYRSKKDCAARCAEENAKKEAFNREQPIRNMLGMSRYRNRAYAWSIHYWRRQVADLERNLAAAKERLTRCKAEKAHLKVNKGETA